VDPLVAKLERSVPLVAPTLANLRPTALQTSALLHDAVPLLHSLRPAADNLAVASRPGLSLLNELGPSLSRLDSTILPDLARTDKETGRTTYEMIGPTLASLDSAASGVDGIGHLISLGLGAGEGFLDTSPCKTFITNPTATQVIECESMAQVLNGLLNYNPLASGSGAAASRLTDNVRQLTAILGRAKR
jgi:hypothetical protein